MDEICTGRLSSCNLLCFCKYDYSSKWAPRIAATDRMYFCMDMGPVWIIYVSTRSTNQLCSVIDVVIIAGVTIYGVLHVCTIMIPYTVTGGCESCFLSTCTTI